MYLEDPSKLIDHAEIARLEAAVEEATDPLVKLQAINRLHQVRAGDPDGYRQAFCAQAKAWAVANDIRPEAFLELGVDVATLRSAGLVIRGPQSRPAARRARSGTSRGQVRVEDVKAAARQQNGNFTLAELVAASGASPMTIRKAVDELVAAGEVDRLGPTPNWSNPGRAPILFRQASKRARR